MTDIVERLRAAKLQDWALDKEAADEIERLRADIDTLTATNTALVQEVEALRQRLVKAQKDAARYQWLRGENSPALVYVGGDCLAEHILDAAIDAAMGAEK